MKSDSTFDSFMETIFARVCLKTEYNRQLMVVLNIDR